MLFGGSCPGDFTGQLGPADSGRKREWRTVIPGKALGAKEGMGLTVCGTERRPI